MKGDTLPRESRTLIDAATGRTIRPVTSEPAIHHHPFDYLPAHDDGMNWLVFVSHRSGRLVQLTDRPDLNGWRIHPAHDGRWVYFTAGSGASRVSTGPGFLYEVVVA
jgi:oligogalacturonide lyase